MSPFTTSSAVTSRTVPSRSTRPVAPPIRSSARAAWPAWRSCQALTPALATITAPMIRTSAVAPIASDSAAPAPSTAANGD